MIALLRTLAARLRTAFSFPCSDSTTARPLAAEQLEPRILYSAAPAPVEAPAQEAAPAPPESAPAPAANEAGEPEVAPAAEMGDSEIAAEQVITLIDIDESAATLNQQTVETLASEAKQRWIDSGISAEQIAALDSVSYGIADVGGAHLGVANGFTITIDDDAGGTGVGNWFIDATPDQDEEFGSLSISAASGRYDLLSTLIHEQGHVLGLGDLTGERSDVMDGLLDTGTRRLPTEGQAERAVIGSLAGDNFLIANIARVSTSTAGAEGTGTSFNASVSADGRYVVFESSANDLVTGDTNFKADIFVKDMQTGELTRVSTDVNGVQGDQDSRNPSISANGRYVVFESDASNLVADDGNLSIKDIFVKDLQTGEVKVASTSSAGDAGNSTVQDSSISADGRYVTFRGFSDNLVAGDTNAKQDVFVKDMKTGKLVRISTDAAGGESDGDSSVPVISANGRFITFQSSSTDLIAGDTNGTVDIFVKDRINGKITRVNTDSAGNQSTGGFPGDATLSANGRIVAFQSSASDLVTGDTNGVHDIFIKDLTTGVTTRVSTDSAGAEANSSSFFGAFSSDGRYVAFVSDATNLVTGDTNGQRDVFVKDTVTGAIERVSTDATGTESTGSSTGNASISGDGRFVVFDSSASDLITGDTNGFTDVFVKGVSSLTRTYTTSVEVNAVGNLLITDIDGADTNDNLFIGLKNGRLEISDTKNTVGTSIVGSALVGNRGRGVSIDLSTFTGNIFVQTFGGNDSVTIGDLSGLPAGIVVSDGDGQDVTRQKGVVTLTGAAELDYRSDRVVLEKRSEIHTDAGSVKLFGNLPNTGAGTFTGLHGDGGKVMSNTGNIDLRGNGGDKGNSNRGVYLKNTDVSTTGNVVIVGVGGSTGSGNGGVQLTTGTDIEVGGTLDIFGTGSALGKSSNYGALIQNATLTTNGVGRLFVQGVGNGSQSSNYGVNFKSATATATGDGIVDIRGFGSTTAAGSANRGVILSSTNISSFDGATNIAASGGTGKNSNSALRAIGTQLNSSQGDIILSGVAQAATTGNTNRGVYFSGGGISSLAGGVIDISGQGGGGLSSNTALTLNLTSLTGVFEVTLQGVANSTTTGSNNRGGDIRNTQVIGNKIDISGTGGTGTNNNWGLLFSRGSIEGLVDVIDVEGTADATTSGSNNFGVRIAGATIEGDVGITIDGTGGGGASRNYGAYISSPTLDAGNGALTITGSAQAGTTGADNRGVQISKVVITAAGVDIDGTAGGGSSRNEGLNITGGSIASLAAVDLDGRAQGFTTGSKNSGVYLNRLTANSSADFNTTGNGGGGTSSNYGVFSSRSTLTSSSGFVDFTALASDQTAGSGNTGLQLLNTTIDGSSTTILATGGNGTNSNRGIYMKGGSLMANNSIVAILTNARDTTSGTRNVGGEFIGTTLDASTDLLITGTGGGGTSNNSGLKFSKGTLSSQSTNVDLTGSGVIGTKGSKNYGIDSASTKINAENVITIEGTGGGGQSHNQGVRIVGGLIESVSDKTVINGGARVETTGSWNAGVYIFNAVMLNSPELEIDGTGGGSLGLNHGVFMDRKITAVDVTPTIDGTPGAGTDSLEKAGDFPFP